MTFGLSALVLNLYALLHKQFATQGNTEVNVHNSENEEIELDDDSLERASGGTTSIDTSTFDQQYYGSPPPGVGPGPGPAGSDNSITLVFASTFIPFDASGFAPGQ